MFCIAFSIDSDDDMVTLDTYWTSEGLVLTHNTAYCRAGLSLLTAFFQNYSVDYVQRFYALFDDVQDILHTTLQVYATLGTIYLGLPDETVV